MLTSREAPNHEEQGRSAGADAYVLKSDRKGTLLKTIRKFLSQEQVQPEQPEVS